MVPGKLFVESTAMVRSGMLIDTPALGQLGAGATAEYFETATHRGNGNDTINVTR